MATLKIELYSDIVCPWCIIGQHRLDKVLRERFPDLDVDVEHQPFEPQLGRGPEHVAPGPRLGLRRDATPTMAWSRACW